MFEVLSLNRCGYFGLGMGIILFAIYGICTPMMLHQCNALRNITTAAGSLAAIVIFISRKLSAGCHR